MELKAYWREAFSWWRWNNLKEILLDTVAIIRSSVPRAMLWAVVPGIVLTVVLPKIVRQYAKIGVKRMMCSGSVSGRFQGFSI